jgi:glycosyltransferase involved in cell wall biosynthesis
MSSAPPFGEPADDIVVSVVIPVYNGVETLGDQLAALQRQRPTERFEVIVADNGSTDRTVDVARRYADGWPPVRVVDASRTAGVAHARNVGAAAARGRLLLFCDADDVVGVGWVGAMVDAWRAGGLVMGGRIDGDGAPDVVAWRGPIQHDGLPADFQPYVLGANLGCDLEVFRRLEGFDESFTIAGEDCDFSFRAQMLGHVPVFVADAVVRYRHRDSIRAAIGQSFRYGQSAAQLYRRWGRDGYIRYGGREQVTRLARLLWGWKALIGGRRSRGAWLWKLSYLTGRLVGAARFHVLFW